MSKAQKFGTFAGVFTPSVLTILGVIMYMRLGWVVGEAGLISAIVIIVIAHVISISTGLSISSVATDKKIKTGGIYYILSRSLGLPMGGAIGIALFIGTALSISLYLVGFAESLLSVEAISHALHLSQDVNSYRIIGTAFLLILTIIAFISTSLAIKSQYFILGAIALSLVSIIIGFFVHTELAPEVAIISQHEGGVSLAVVFGIFFPAVTGFTAGVAMSGDLEDPKKSIPSGTLASIAVGLVVYISLAIAFAYFINRDLLINDTNFLLKVAIFSPLVLAGIWGATLSSALGGILGGPRILQAISQDKITPAIFGKGYGESNEPRNALMLIFVIAEIGILIGELNVIAGVVSMFYLASYGFINLAFFLESWASTDFCPSFKVSRYTGLIGFVASFGVMYQLDILSMFASLIIMFLIYLWLSKKQLGSEYGDVWQSVWMSVVRHALHKMDNKTMEQRNWQPNILLFSGGTNKRPHLIEFGKSLVGKYGMLSNFDLHESVEKKYLFPKYLQSIANQDFDGKGIFTRRQTCSDIYLGIETIVSTYGFSGIEPNTVLMGWARESQNPERFVNMIQRIYELDTNLILIDYDQRYGYGKYETIDIWWRGSGHHGNLALSLVKFLWSSEEWNNAKLRLLIVNPVNDDAPKIRAKAEQVIDNLRISAEIKIINNQIEKKDFYDLIRTESINTDLILLGFPEIKKGKEANFVEETSELMHDIGTVVLMKASSQFKALNFGIKRHFVTEKDEENIENIISDISEIKEIDLPSNAVASENLQTLVDELRLINTDVYNNYLRKISDNFKVLPKNIDSKLEHLFNTNFSEILHAETSKKSQITSLSIDKMLVEIDKLINNYKIEFIDKNKAIYENALNLYLSETSSIIQKVPEYQFYTYGEDILSFSEKDTKKDRKFKKNKQIQLKLNKNPLHYKVKYKKLIASYLPLKTNEIIKETASKFGTLNIQNIVELQIFIRFLRTSLLELSIKAQNSEISKEILEEYKQKISDKFIESKKVRDKSAKAIFVFMQNKTMELAEQISNDLKSINVNSLIKRTKKSKKELTEEQKQIVEIPELWSRTQKLLYNAWSLELKLVSFENKLSRTIITGKSLIKNNTESNFNTDIKKTSQYLLNFISEFSKNTNTKFLPENLIKNTDKESLFLQFKEILDSRFKRIKKYVDKFPETIELITNEGYNDLLENQYDEIETVEISALSLIDYIVQNELNAPMLNIIDKLPQELINIQTKVKNIIRLISFSFFDSEGKLINSEINTKEKVIDFINEQIHKVDECYKKIEEQSNTVERQIDKAMRSVSEKMTTYQIISITDNFKQYVSRHGMQKTKSFISQKYLDMKTNITDKINRLWYRHSEAVLLKKSIDKQDSQMKTKVNSMLDLLENSSPNSHILNQLPFYYKQLFLREHNYNNEFRFGSEKELNSMQKSIERYKNGYYGAILVTGEKLSGKTFFVNYSLTKFLPNAKVYTINSPASGSVKLDIFKEELSKATQINGSYERIFTSLEANSVIVFENLELWWEKAPQGFVIIDKIIELLDKYSNKFLFVLNSNINSFGLMNRIKKIENKFINIIEIQAQNAEQLKNIVLFRHNSGGLQFKFKNKMQENMRQADFAKLFARHFNYSQGNVGVTLLSWMSNIEEIEDNKLKIKMPSQLDTSVLNNLDTEILMILVQFVLHRALTVEKLMRISLKSEKEIDLMLSYLKRSGILVEEFPGIYEINKFLYIHIKQKLENIEMI